MNNLFVTLKFNKSCQNCLYIRIIDILGDKMFILVNTFLCRMAFEDFVEYFSRIDVCNLGRESVANKGFHLTQHRGHWTKGRNAGGNNTFPGQQSDQFYTDSSRCYHQYCSRLDVR